MSCSSSGCAPLLSAESRARQNRSFCFCLKVVGVWEYQRSGKTSPSVVHCVQRWCRICGQLGGGLPRSSLWFLGMWPLGLWYEGLRLGKLRASLFVLPSCSWTASGSRGLHPTWLLPAAPPCSPPHTPFRWVLFQSRCREHLSLGISRLHTCSGAREARCGRDLLLPCPGRSSMLGAVGFPGSADRPCGDGARPFGPQRPQSAFLRFFLCSLVHNSLGKKVSSPPLYWWANQMGGSECFAPDLN